MTDYTSSIKRAYLQKRSVGEMFCASLVILVIAAVCSFAAWDAERDLQVMKRCFGAVSRGK